MRIKWNRSVHSPAALFAFMQYRIEKGDGHILRSMLASYIEPDGLPEELRELHYQLFLSGPSEGFLLGCAVFVDQLEKFYNGGEE